MSSDNLPSLLGAANNLATPPGRRDLARVERTVSRDVALVRGKAQVLAERGRASTRAIEDVALDAMDAGTAVARHAVALANSCPMAEPMLRSITEQTGLALGRVVSDTAKDLR